MIARAALTCAFFLALSFKNRPCRSADAATRTVFSMYRGTSNLSMGSIGFTRWWLDSGTGGHNGSRAEGAGFGANTMSDCEIAWAPGWDFGCVQGVGF